MVGVDFLTCTPRRCTSSGRRGRASCSLFCVSICATLRSVPMLKVTVIVSFPSPVDWLLMYSMFSTPLISCSGGVATVRATVSADAPGYVVVTWTVGGTTSGYCATGRIARAPSPSSVTNMLRTAAKRGRLMKKCVRRIVEGPFLVLTRDGGVADRAVLHRDLGSRRRIREPFYDDPVARTEAGPNDA